MSEEKKVLTKAIFIKFDDDNVPHCNIAEDLELGQMLELQGVLNVSMASIMKFIHTKRKQESGKGRILRAGAGRIIDNISRKVLH